MAQLRPLTLGRAHNQVILQERSNVPAEGMTGRNLPRDLYQIFGENRIWFPSWRGKLDLAAKDSSNRPPYRIEAERGNYEWRVHFGNIKDPAQAAAWAALSLYERKHGYHMGVANSLRVDDAQATTHHLFEYGQIYAKLSGEDRSLSSMYDGFSGAEVTWRHVNDDGLLDLPTSIRKIHERRQMLHGEYADPLAATAMIGAQVAIDRVADAWNEALEVSSPVEAARQFLDSDIFKPMASGAATT